MSFLYYTVTEDHEKAVEYFVSTLSNIAYATVPRSKPCNKTNNTVWCTTNARLPQEIGRKALLK